MVTEGFEMQKSYYLDCSGLFPRGWLSFLAWLFRVATPEVCFVLTRQDFLRVFYSVFCVFPPSRGSVQVHAPIL